MTVNELIRASSHFWAKYYFFHFNINIPNDISEDEVRIASNEFENEFNYLLNSDKDYDKKVVQNFWIIFDCFYNSLNKKILKSNVKYIYAPNASRKIQKEYKKSVVEKLKPLKHSDFMDLQSYVMELFSSLHNFEKFIDIQFFYDANNNSNVPEIGYFDDDIICVILNRNVIRIFNANINLFKSIFLHELAHISQKDSRFLFRRYYNDKRFIKGNFYTRLGFLGIINIFLPIVAIFIFLLFYINDNHSTAYKIDKIISIAKNMSMHLILGIFVSFWLVRRLHLNFTGTSKNTRIRSEFGADLFSILKGRDFSLLKFLEDNKEEEANNRNGELHISNIERANHLRMSLSYFLIIAKHEKVAIKDNQIVIT